MSGKRKAEDKKHPALDVKNKFAEAWAGLPTKKRKTVAAISLALKNPKMKPDYRLKLRRTVKYLAEQTHTCKSLTPELFKKHERAPPTQEQLEKLDKGRLEFRLFHEFIQQRQPKLLHAESQKLASAEYKTRGENTDFQAKKVELQNELDNKESKTKPAKMTNEEKTQRAFARRVYQEYINEKAPPGTPLKSRTATATAGRKSGGFLMPKFLAEKTRLEGVVKKKDALKVKDTNKKLK